MRREELSDTLPGSAPPPPRARARTAVTCRRPRRRPASGRGTSSGEVDPRWELVLLLLDHGRDRRRPWSARAGPAADFRLGRDVPHDCRRHRRDYRGHQRAPELAVRLRVAVQLNAVLLVMALGAASSSSSSGALPETTLPTISVCDLPRVRLARFHLRSAAVSQWLRRVALWAHAALWCHVHHYDDEWRRWQALLSPPKPPGRTGAEIDKRE